MLCIVSIVERGKATNLVNAAKKVGAKGATIFYGRGTGEKEIEKYFKFYIESSKEIILIICEDSKAEIISNAIITEGKLTQPGKGILFTIPVLDIKGIV